ncbi:AAA family ATPase [Actinomadura roseirufa]|uniref:AAA family ATPase n=1 Tax=Actinomadura roseirufa TaxID=2094049 RepID=UPI001041090E|nr:AAA family ATPase [Actinomadura roseirufa]
MPEVLVICGPGGVGKSSTAFEAAHRLADLDVPHALIDSDELDRVHPWPPPGMDAAELSRRNLAALWSTFAEAGHTRLLVTGVFADLAADLRWVAEAVPDAEITTVRLVADEATLRDRIERREIGSAAEAQLRRTLDQLAQMQAADPPTVHRINTAGRTVTEVAAQIIDHWVQDRP